MEEKTKYYLLKQKAVPEVLLKVAEAKKLIASEKAMTIQEATDQLGISRSSFYKYKDDIFPFYEGRQKQADLCGKWFSAKETGEQLIRKAQQYLDAYRKYVEFLEKVVELNPKDLDMELNFSKFESILKEATPEAREALLSKYRD